MGRGTTARGVRLRLEVVVCGGDEPGRDAAESANASTECLPHRLGSGVVPGGELLGSAVVAGHSLVAA
jgi:hypothetical protein